MSARTIGNREPGRVEDAPPPHDASSTRSSPLPRDIAVERTVESLLGPVRRSLQRNAQVFDSPAHYLAGVEDALYAVRRLLCEELRHSDAWGRKSPTP